MERRTDRLSALYVDAVLNVCRRDHADSATVILLDHGLPLDTVMRIVNAPKARRHGWRGDCPYRSTCQQAPQLCGLVSAERIAEQAADQRVVDDVGMRGLAFGVGVE